MSVDMKGSRDGYRGRYRDRHSSGSTNRNNYTDRLTTNGNSRENSSHSNYNNGNHSSRYSPNESQCYRPSRTAPNSRPVSSRNNSSTQYRYQNNVDYSPPSHSSSSLPNRTSNVFNGQSNYYENQSSPPRYDRTSNHREPYLSELDALAMMSNGSIPPTSSYYASSQSIPHPRDRGPPIPLLQHIDTERDRHVPSSSSSSTYRRNSPLPSTSSYRNERSVDYGSRNANNDSYIRGEYRPLTPPALATLSIRGEPYGDIYRVNDYGSRSERFDISSHRNSTSSRDYPLASAPSSNYRTDLYRSSSSVSMSSPASYVSRDQYSHDANYRPISQPRDYGATSSSSRTNYPSLMDHQDASYRNTRDRNYNDSRSSHRDRPNLKRSNSRYDDDGPMPPKRPMRR